MCGAPERLPGFSVLTFSMVQDLNEKIAGVDCMMRRLYVALHIS
jgi:hypothetical protein